MNHSLRIEGILCTEQRLGLFAIAFCDGAFDDDVQIFRARTALYDHGSRCKISDIGGGPKRFGFCAAQAVERRIERVETFHLVPDRDLPETRMGYSKRKGAGLCRRPCLSE